jgi:hypothetical protein
MLVSLRITIVRRTVRRSLVYTTLASDHQVQVKAWQTHCSLLSRQARWTAIAFNASIKRPHERKSGPCRPPLGLPDVRQRGSTTHRSWLASPARAPGQERLRPSYFFISLVPGLLNSLVWHVPSLRYTCGLGWRIHCGVEVTESSTNKQNIIIRL